VLARRRDQMADGRRRIANVGTPDLRLAYQIMARRSAGAR
jgi:hypothetical protein